MNLGSFFTRVLPAGCPAYWLSTLSVGSKGSMQFKRLHSMQEVIDLATTPPTDVNCYFRVQGYDDSEGKKGENVVQVKSFWIDLDVGPGDDKYQTQKDAAQALARACKELALPLPMIVVSSGVGLQGFWTLTESITAVQWVPSAKLLEALFDSVGLKLDHSRATDVASLMRLPGSVNQKTVGWTPEMFSAEGRLWGAGEATILQATEGDLDPEFWVKSLQGAAEARGVTVQPMQEASEASEAPPANRFPIAAMAAELAQFDPDCSEEFWRTVMFSISGETGQSQEGYELFNDWSIGRLGGHPVPTSYNEASLNSRWASAHAATSRFGMICKEALGRLLAAYPTPDQVARADRLQELKAAGAPVINITHEASLDFSPAQMPTLAGVAAQIPKVSKKTLASGVALPTAETPVVLPMEVLEAVGRDAQAQETKAKKAARAAELVVAKEQSNAASDIPERFKHFCWTGEDATFYNFHNGAHFSETAFDKTFKSVMATLPGCGHAKPSDLLLHKTSFLETRVTSGSVLRPAEGMIIEVPNSDGTVTLSRNSYPLKDRVDVPVESTEESRRAWHLFQQHILWGWCMGDQEVFTHAFAHVCWIIRNPGIRRHQILVVAGASGLGKSIVAQIVGNMYAGQVLNTTLEKIISSNQFERGIHTRVLTVLDEMGNSRPDHRKFAEWAKSEVSLAQVESEVKGKTATTVTATSSFMCFSNWPQLIEVDRENRRTLYIEPSWESKEAFWDFMYEKIPKEHRVQNYKTDVMDFLGRKSTAALLLREAQDYKFPDGYHANSDVFITPECLKKMGRASTQYGEQLDAVINSCDELHTHQEVQDSFAVTKNTVSTISLRKILARDEDTTARDISKQAVLAALTSIGFEPALVNGTPLRVKHESQWHPIWVRTMARMDRGAIETAIAGTKTRKIMNTNKTGVR